VFQITLENAKPGATIVPVIISSDKTQLTTFRNKAAYPVYLTIGNIPKRIRSKSSSNAQILLAYLPTERLDHIPGEDSRRRATANLYHGAMKKILQPLETFGETGILMTRANGAVHRCHPIFACYVGDYPEQCLASGTLSGHCPQGRLSCDQLGDPPPLDQPHKPNCSSHNLQAIEEALALNGSDEEAFVDSCNRLGIRPIPMPFWRDLPYANPFLAATPDVLHQLYQGVIKHLVDWLRQACGDSEIDARCRRMPPNHCTRIFTKGLSSLSQISGKEHRQICAILLGLVADLPLESGQLPPEQLIVATRAALDFLYLAQLPIHSTTTLKALTDSLVLFHENKQVFVDLGIRNDFNFPKLHALSHYHNSITMFGTTDNYNTEYTERLHIDLAKDAYRATNHRDEFLQMTKWLERREKMLKHNAFIKSQLEISPEVTVTAPIVAQPLQDSSKLTLYLRPATSKYPSVKSVSLDSLTDDYGTQHFGDALAEFVVKFYDPASTNQQTINAVKNLLIPLQKVAVFHRLKLYDSNNQVQDAVHVQPTHKNKQGHNTPGRFDTVLVKYRSMQEHTLQSMFCHFTTF
jgi:hypothetical protein